MKTKNTIFKTVLGLLLLLSTLNFLQASGFSQRESRAYAAVSIQSAMYELFGSSHAKEDSRIILQAPEIVSNGSSIPIHISTSIPAKRVALFQDANPEALVVIWNVLESSIIEYDVKLKMANSGTLRVVVQGRDGQLYTTHKTIQIALGGCDGTGGSYYSGPSNYKPYAPKQRSSYSRQKIIDRSEYAFINENTFKDTSSSPLSTFSSDVDTASYANVRNHLMVRNQLPVKDAVRLEEMINYFSYDYVQAKENKPFYISTKIGKSLWNENSQIIHIALQTKKLDISELPASNLVFLLDVSGSMYAQNKLPLLIKSLKLLVQELRSIDKVSIVVYAGSSGLILDRASGDEKEKIYAALDSLRAGGSTAGGKGIQLAYEIAKKAFIYNGNNRVILATDGDFNVGVRSESDLLELIQSKRKSGVFLSVLGFGDGNYKDNKMELLADKGNGNYQYIDSLLEAKKVLVTQMSGTLYTVAKDVKIQVEFNPAKVHSYRLIGYENRLIANEDFNNDKKDAGEIGMGHRLTVLYEIITNANYNKEVDELKYQKMINNDLKELATIKIRYKTSTSNSAKSMSKVIRLQDNEIAKEDFYFAQVVAGFGMLLRNSNYVKELGYKELIEKAKDFKGKDRDGNRAEMIRMMEKASLLKDSQGR
ncbi:MAG TPA: DUF3520 domain-containing protein [Sulfurimonas sp.]|nr:DUF3520 domain-containing protein [Sulfurimonas sp.]